MISNHTKHLSIQQSGENTDLPVTATENIVAKSSEKGHELLTNHNKWENNNFKT